MKQSIRLLLAALGIMSALLGSQAASASPIMLSPQDCHSYPFVKVQHITHQDRMNELRLDEEAGFNPGKNDPLYPNSIEAANHALHQAYLQDCQ